MLLHTPDDLGIKLVVAAEHGESYAICHPGVDGPPDLSTGVVIHVDPPNYKVIRVFDVEIVSMAFLSGTLFCVDSFQRVYALSGGRWTDMTNPALRPYRINDLRAVNGELFGIGSDGMIFLWRANTWNPIKDEQKKLYLYDIAYWGDNGYVISGESGFLATLQGRVLGQMPLPTNTDLTCVLPLSNDSLLVTGWDATAFIVRQNEVQVIDTAGRELSFLNAVRWNAKILIAADDEILELKGANLEEFSAERATLLSTTGERLWRQSSDGIAYLDLGNPWVNMPLSADI